MTNRHNATGFTAHEIAKADIAERRDYVGEETGFEDRIFDGPVAEVSVTMGVTCNLGNYEAARLDVGIRVPCAPSEADEMAAQAQEWCEKKIQAEVRKIRKRGR